MGSEEIVRWHPREPEAASASRAGIKHDSGKLRLDLIPPEAVRALGNVLTYGAAKYGPNNWRGIEPARYEAALLRHWLAWKEGEAIDPESGLPHLAHVLTNAAFLAALESSETVGEGKR